MKYTADGTPVKDVYDHYADCQKELTVLRDALKLIASGLSVDRGIYIGRVFFSYPEIAKDALKQVDKE